MPPVTARILSLAASDGPGIHSLWEWIEANGRFTYPAVAVVVIGLMVWALLAGFRTDRLNAEQRGALKMRIVQLMRRRVSGVSAEAVSAELQIEILVAARLLSELAEEGLIDASSLRASPGAAIQYRIRGR